MKKESIETFNKPNEAIKYFEQLLKSPRSTNDTSGLGYTITEEGESSKSVEEINNKGKNSKLTFHNCGKKGILLMCSRTRIQITMSSLKILLIVIATKRKVIRHMNIKLGPCINKYLKDIATTIKIWT